MDPCQLSLPCPKILDLFFLFFPFFPIFHSTFYDANFCCTRIFYFSRISVGNNSTSLLFFVESSIGSMCNFSAFYFSFSFLFPLLTVQVVVFYFFTPSNFTFYSLQIDVVTMISCVGLQEDIMKAYWDM